MVDFGARPQLREGVPLKLVWRFGPNPFSGVSSGPSASIKRFASISIEPTVGGGADTVDFRNVPAVLSKTR